MTVRIQKYITAIAACIVQKHVVAKLTDFTIT